MPAQYSRDVDTIRLGAEPVAASAPTNVAQQAMPFGEKTTRDVGLGLGLQDTSRIGRRCSAASWHDATLISGAY